MRPHKDFTSTTYSNTLLSHQLTYVLFLSFLLRSHIAATLTCMALHVIDSTGTSCAALTPYRTTRRARTRNKHASNNTLAFCKIPLEKYGPTIRNDTEVCTSTPYSAHCFGFIVHRRGRLIEITKIMKTRWHSSEWWTIRYKRSSSSVSDSYPACCLRPLLAFAPESLPRYCHKASYRSELTLDRPALMVLWSLTFSAMGSNEPTNCIVNNDQNPYFLQQEQKK